MEFEMKKFSVLFFALVLALFSISCGGGGDGGKECNPDEECCGNECPDNTTDTVDDKTDGDTGDTQTDGDEDVTTPDDDKDVTTPDDDSNSADCYADFDDTIEKIQKGEISEQAEVTTQCVVTGIFYDQDEEFNNTAIKGVYVSELIPEAKPYTGIYVFIKATAPVDEYKVGDKLEVKGIYKEYYDNSQIEASDIKKLGTCPLPEPAVVEPASVATPFEVSGKDDNGYDTYAPTANHGPDAEKYEGVLIQVEDVEITNKYIGHGNFELDNSLVVTKTLFYYEGDRSKGTKFDSITGILVYEFEAFRLAPRSADDFVGGDSADSDTGHDDTDADTGDTVAPTTVKEIQSGTKEKKDLVRIENAIVISPVISKSFSDGGTGYTLYVSDGNRGDYSGLYIYQVTADTAPAKGDKVTIEGQVDFYGNQWEVKNAKNAGSITKTGTGTVPAALEKAYTALSDKDKGTLIKVTDTLTVDSVETPEGKNYTKVTFKEKVGEDALIAENFGTVKLPALATGDKVSVTGIYDTIFGSNGFYVIDANDIVKK